MRWSAKRVGRPESRALPIVLAAVLGVVILGVDALAIWLAEIGEPRASNYLTPLVGAAVLVVAWVSFWALLSRVYSGRARFARNLLIALAGLLGFSIYNEVAQFSAFAVTWRAAVNYEYVAMWSILAAACFFHLREVGPSRLKLKGAVVAALLALVIGIQTLQQSEAFYDSGRQNTVRSPHAARAPPRPGARRAHLLFRNRAAQGHARQRPCAGTEQGRGPVREGLADKRVMITGLVPGPESLEAASAA